MLGIDYTLARQLMSSLSPTQSPYDCLLKHLPNFNKLEFSSQMEIICECVIPLPKSTCTILTTTIEDCDFGMVYVDGSFITYLDVTDVIRNDNTSHVRKLQSIREMLINEGFVSDYQIEPMLLLKI